MQNNQTKKVALVTGASRGIGKGIAEYLLSEHYRVILVSKNIERLKKTYDEFCSKFSKENIEYLDIDLTNHTELANKIDQLLKKAGRIDVLVNNAGYAKRGTSELEHDELLKMIETNLISVFDIVRCVSKVMKEQQSGYIVNISSHSGIIARSHLGGYAASKFGLMGFNQALRKELAPHGICVTAICPNFVDTDMVKDVKSIQKDDLMQVDDVVKTVAYLLSLSPTATVEKITLQCRAHFLTLLDA